MAETVKTSVERTALRDHARALDKAICDLHFDMEALAWGCEQLWMAEEKGDLSHQLLARFPVAIIRMLADRTRPLMEHSEKLDGIVR